MKIKIVIVFLVCTNFLFSQTNTSYVPNEVLVKIKGNTLQTETEVDQFFETQEMISIKNQLQVVNYTIIKNKSSKNTLLIQYSNTTISVDDAIEIYKNTQKFEYVEPNYLANGNGQSSTTPNDALYSRQWGLYNDGSFSNAPATVDADIDMELAWDIETGDPNMIVAVIDSGLRLSHPEFSGRIWTNTAEVADGTDTDNNGFIDDLSAGWDFINNDNDPADDHGHGSNVAGIAFATGNNGTGYAGVNWNSKVMICKALDNNNSGSYAAMAGSIYYAVDNGAKVINMSIGGSGNSSTLSDAIDYCYNNGVVLVACMMNFNDNVSYYPAAYNRTIAVGSTDPDDTRSDPFFWSGTSGSNFGNHIDIVAPGNYMYGISAWSDTNYNSYWGGTSQATPLVAGVVSLLFAQDPSLTFEEIRTILRDSAEDQVGDPLEDISGFDIYYGYGRLNAHNALTSSVLSNNDVELNVINTYPNPIAHKNFTIENLHQGNYEIDLYNVLGQLQFSKNAAIISNNLNITMPNLKAGIYNLKVYHKETKQLFYKKIIVQ